MAYLCYSLTEAAQKLDLSETVLIRLSQFLRVPATAYDSLGRSVTYKGDLLLTDVDLAFFKQVKDRLLKGESLEDIKRRIVPDAIDLDAIDISEPTPAQDIPQRADEGLRPQQPVPEMKSTSAILQSAADKSFNRYRAEHRTAPTQIFRNLVQDTQEPTNNKTTQNSHSQASSAEMVARMASGSAEFVKPRIPQTSTQPQAFSGQLQSGKLAKNVFVDQPWQALIQAALNQPRPLNTQLKTAAQLLKQKALRLQRTNL